MMRNWSLHSQKAGHYALTCFSALSKYMEYYISYPSVHVYSSNPEKLSKGLMRGRGGIVVHILRSDSDLIFRNTRLMKDLAIVEPIQVVVDLFYLGGAGRDGAMKLYQSLIESKNAKKQKEFQTKGGQQRKHKDSNKGLASSRKKLLRRTA